MSDKLESQLREHGAEMYIRRVALDPVHIRALRLPTRPGKATDSRHARFSETYGDACVELDALPPNVLSRMVHTCISQHVDQHAFQQARLEEAAARETLKNLSFTNWQPGTVYHFND